MRCNVFTWKYFLNENQKIAVFTYESVGFPILGHLKIRQIIII